MHRTHLHRRCSVALSILAGVAIVLGSSVASAGPKGESRSAEAHEANDERQAARASGGSQNDDGGSTQSNGDTRGASPSQPDQDGVGMDRGAFNGDEDKPPSGDGNNGCGNDADREDDNNGWCGKPEVSGGSEVEDDGDVEVRGTIVRREAAEVQAAAVEGGSLATTGAPLLGLIPVGIALAALGMLMVVSARKRAAR